MVPICCEKTRHRDGIGMGDLERETWNARPGRWGLRGGLVGEWAAFEPDASAIE